MSLVVQQDWDRLLERIELHKRLEISLLVNKDLSMLFKVYILKECCGRCGFKHRFSTPCEFAKLELSWAD